MKLGTDQTVARVWDHQNPDAGMRLVKVWGGLPDWPTEASKHAIATYAPFPRRDSSSPQRVEFIGSKMREYARDLALWELAGIPCEYTAAEQIVHGCCDVALHCGFPFSEGLAAGEAEARNAAAFAREFVDHLRRVVYPLARDGASVEALLDAAEKVNAQRGRHLPTELVRGAVKVIAQSAVQPARAKQRGRR